MNSSVVTLDPVHSQTAHRTILSKDGFTCSLLTLALGEEASAAQADQVEEHLLFVVEGEVTVRMDDVNTILNKHEALLIPRGKAHAVSAATSGGSKLLRVDIPPRNVVAPQIISFDR